MTALERWDAIRRFVKRVNRRAERKMAHTGKLEGSHYAAMCEELSVVQREAEAEVMGEGKTAKVKGE